MNESRRHEGGSRPRDRPRNASRRRFLSAAATAASASVTGCLDRDLDFSVGDDGTDEGWRTVFPGRLDDFDPVDPGTTPGRFVYDVGFAPAPGTHDPLFVLAEDFEETSSSVSITVAPDLEWSNGDPLTATGIGRWVYMLRMGSGTMIPVPEISDGTRQPRTAWEAITAVDWEGRTVTVEGEFDRAPSPLFELNTYLGSRPRAHYDRLWESFRNAYDDVPWEDEETWAAVTTLVDDNVWYLDAEYRPESGFHLAEDDDGSGREAAFSGLWYPSRIGSGRLYFTTNDTHPFADRVSFDTVIWDFQGERADTTSSLRRGEVDGMTLTTATEPLLEAVPSHFDAFEGRARDVISVTVNHRDRHLRERDVRAALMYALDRDRLVESLDLATRRPVSVPGADLQIERWMPRELRETMRSYDYDPDRARALLERSGFRYSDDEWRTPDGDTFTFELMTASGDPTLPLSIVDQLKRFGFDANMFALEATSYQTHREDGTFQATHSTWSSPSAEGRPRTRAGDYVRTITSGDRFRDSSYLEREVETAIERSDDLDWVERAGREFGVYDVRSLEYDTVDALQSITVEAPPFGDPDGDLREWPYLYHAVRAERARDDAERIEHARICTWIYNYVVPELELLAEVPLVFHNTRDWTVPEAGDVAWRHVGHGRHPGDLWAALAWGQIDRA